MDPKKERYRRIRGAILKILAGEHPGSIDILLLHFSLDNLGYTITKEEFLSHISYLENKKPALLKLNKRKVGNVEIEMAMITPEGLDVLDGFEPNSGIDVRF
jgi:hypothetical protein